MATKFDEPALFHCERAAASESHATGFCPAISPKSYHKHCNWTSALGLEGGLYTIVVPECLHQTSKMRNPANQNE